MTELALSIVFANTTCFQDLTKEQTKMLVFTCKDAQLNENVEKMRIKYQVNHFHNTLKDLLYSLARFDHNKDQIQIDECNTKINKMLYDDMYERDDEFADAFSRLMMAEYKERIFDDLYDPSADNCMDKIILECYDKIIITDSCFYDPYNHYHDPSHYMFTGDGTHYEYSFHELFEKHETYSIIDKWKMPDEEYDD
jgi:hypothetical protein